MKKIISVAGIFLMLFSHAALFAQMPVPAAPLGVSSGMERIGVVAAARGNVELKMPGQVGRIGQSGQPVFMGDEIKTDAQGNLQILLCRDNNSLVNLGIDGSWQQFNLGKTVLNLLLFFLRDFEFVFGLASTRRYNAGFFKHVMDG